MPLTLVLFMFLLAPFPGLPWAEGHPDWGVGFVLRGWGPSSTFFQVPGPGPLPFWGKLSQRPRVTKLELGS